MKSLINDFVCVVFLDEDNGSKNVDKSLNVTLFLSHVHCIYSMDFGGNPYLAIYFGFIIQSNNIHSSHFLASSNLSLAKWQKDHAFTENSVYLRKQRC